MSLLPIPEVVHPPRSLRRSGRSGALSRVRDFLVACVLLGMVLPAAAQIPAEGTSEYQQKARLICNFLRNCKWPDRRFPAAESPFVIGVFGSDQISEFLRENIQDRRVQGRPVQIRHLTRKEELTICHLVFVSRSERARQPMIVSETRRANVLTVGESDNFLASGGMIQFITDFGQVRYRVSFDAARRERIEPNGFVLRMALPQSGARPPEERRLAERP